MLKKMQELAMFIEQRIRRHRDDEQEKWLFSVIDIIAILTEQRDYQGARNYWKVLKNRLQKEWNQTVTNCNQLKMLASDGKMRLTDVADVETLLRLIQSIPSPKAEPLKLWLAKVGYERMQETLDPERSLGRARENWKNQGRSEKWIQQRMMGQETRNKLTDYWQEHGIQKGKEYAILTNIIHQEWTGMTVQEHKKLKHLGHQNLRDHMSEAELIFTALAELSTRQIAESSNAIGMKANKKASKKGWSVAKQARKQLEDQTGKSVINEQNFLPRKE